MNEQACIFNVRAIDLDPAELVDVLRLVADNVESAHRRALAGGRPQTTA